MKHKLPLFIAALFVFIGCKKDTPAPAPIPVKEYYMDESLKAYFSFKPGTFWVYQDSLTGQIDTVSVESHNIGLTNAAPFYPEKPEKYEDGGTILRHSRNKKISVYRFHTFGNFIHYNSELNTQGPIFTLPDSALRSSNGYNVRVSAEKQVSAGSFTFPKGVEVNNIAAEYWDFTNSSVPPGFHRWSYFWFVHARDIGIIKRTIKNDTLHQVWELVDYKIVR